MNTSPETDSAVTLESIYRQVNEVILSRQHPVTGLFPASTDINLHGDYTDAWVRDNVYTIMAPWATSLALRKAGDTVRADQLEQAAIKMMRGLLNSMMRQSHKVEAFKYSLDPKDSLHAKYNTATGLEVVADDAWGHLQIDATSIFLLLLAQMTAGGLRIIFTQSEVNFVQNLIFYISRAYRIRDFGIWERGNKINNGKPEVNASSVGMAKAALIALDGLNLFGPQGPESAVVHTIADAIARADAILHSLLPRESRSKECDSALLSIIGFPAFAVEDTKLAQRTRDEIRTKLEGRFGCKRFLLDGHQSVLEDHSRIYYEHSELAGFENIESEWPLFYTYLYIAASFSDDQPLAGFYRTKLEQLMVEKDGFKLLPELYYVPRDKVAAEKEQPGSQERCANDNVPLIWAQSLYNVGLLLHEGFIDCDDLDPLGLHRRQQKKPQKPSIALVLIAQNDHVKRKLQRYGVISETLRDIRPLKVISSEHLVDAFASLGACAQLELTGRPRRTLQSLATSHPYNINGQQLLTLSWMQDNPIDYRKSDAQMLSEIIHSEIKYIEKHWFYDEPAVFTLMIDKEMCDLPEIDAFFVTLRGFQHRSISDYISHATAGIASRAAHTNRMHIPNICLNPLSEHSVISWRQGDAQPFSPLLGGGDSAAQVQELKKLCASRALGDTLELDGNSLSVEALLLAVYQRARRQKDWLLMRVAYALMLNPSSELADAVSELHVRRLAIIVGQSGQGSLIGESFSSLEVANTIAQFCPEPLEQALIQEILLTLGNLVRTEPQLFEGLRSIRLNHLLTLCVQQREDYDKDACGLDGSGCREPQEVIGQLTPHEFFLQLRRIIAEQHRAYSEGLAANLNSDDAERVRHSDASRGLVLDTDWFEWRLARGLITRIDPDLLQAIWNSLKQVRHIAFDDQCNSLLVLDCERARNSMTAGEENFALLIEKFAQQLHPAYYKSIVLEALSAFTEFCREDKKADFGECLYLGDIVNRAAEFYRSDNIDSAHIASNERTLDYFMQSPPQIAQVYFKRALKNAAVTLSDRAKHVTDKDREAN